jgi:hypothetical protein
VASETPNMLIEIATQSTDSYKVKREFSKSLFENIFFKNKSALTLDADKVPFDKQEWHQNPMKLCLDYYGEADLAKVIMLANNIGSIMEFKRGKVDDGLILLPQHIRIKELLSHV